jgi:hypothetical protein
MHIAATAFAVLLILGCYFGSLRRTPYHRIWLLVTIAALALAVPIGLTATHVQPGGLFAAELGLSMIVIIPAIGTEGTFHDSKNGAIAKYRDRHPTRIGIMPEKWQVEVLSGGARYGEGYEIVQIRKGDKTRVIGHTDMIEDVDAFYDMKIKAEQIRDEYNREKIAA